MSCVPVDVDESCANCGGRGSDTLKLKNCTACLLVKYCSVDCQKAHRKQHKKACKQRAAKLKDERLYNQGHERPEADSCPICTLPIPLPKAKHSLLNLCCMKRICNGCDHAAKKRGMYDCPFCRTPYPKDDAGSLAMVRARVAKKDPEAIAHLGTEYSNGNLGLQQNMRRAVELWKEAAELGSVGALHNIAVSYYKGEGVERDEVKSAEFHEKAAMKGDAQSRHNLGCNEGEGRNYHRAVKHLSISAKMGHKGSLESIKKMFMGGVVTKQKYAEALKGYQDAVEETKSHERDEVKRLFY